MQQTLIAGIPGGPELVIIVALAVLLFAASKIPQLAHALGRSTNEFERGRVESKNGRDG